MIGSLKAIGFALAFTVGVIGALLVILALLFLASERFGPFEVICGVVVAGSFLCGLCCYADIQARRE